MHKWLVILLGLGFLLLTGCSKTPLDKVKSHTFYPELNNAFWSKEADKKSPLWQDALTYCGAHTGKPNCGSVISVFMMKEGLKLDNNPLKSPF